MTALGTVVEAGVGGLAADLVAWVTEVTGAPVVAATRQPGGGRRQAWFVDTAADELFLRVDGGPPDAADPWTLAREAVVHRALARTAVPVPRFIAAHPDGRAVLMGRCRGDARFSRIADVDERDGIARDFMRCLAEIHRLDPASLDLPGFPTTASVPDLVRLELDEWEHSLVTRGGGVDPVLRLALDWLRANVPSYEGPAVLVQGDTGPGNFLFADGRVEAIVDWELAHLGDPMDDLAWLSLRSTQEPFGDLAALVADYERQAGHAVDAARLRYYRVLAETKLRVMYHRPGGPAERLAGGDAGNGLVYEQLHQRLWLEAFAEAVGVELPDVPPLTAPTTDRGWLYDEVVAQLRDVILPAIDDAHVARQLKSLARVVKYLAAVDRFGPSGGPDDGGDTCIDDVLCGAWRHSSRENDLLRSASGALADRHWPDLV